jgi:hypothetical protein
MNTFSQRTKSRFGVTLHYFCVTFCVTAGMGLATYIAFVLALARDVGGSRRILLLELPHVSMKLGQENVPSMNTAVSTAAAVMKKHAFAPALWVSALR